MVSTIPIVTMVWESIRVQYGLVVLSVTEVALVIVVVLCQPMIHVTILSLPPRDHSVEYTTISVSQASVTSPHTKQAFSSKHVRIAELVERGFSIKRPVFESYLGHFGKKCGKAGIDRTSFQQAT